VQIKLPKSLIKYAAITALVGIGAYVYLDDHEAPRLEGFVFESTGTPGTYAYSGAITDARGTSWAEFTCIEDSDTKLVVHLAMSGAQRHSSSFGILGRSPQWTGSWKGTSYELEFSGRAVFPPGSDPVSCRWQVELKDNVGNRATNLLQEQQIPAN
jgi:hypothetical protein